MSITEKPSLKTPGDNWTRLPIQRPAYLSGSQAPRARDAAGPHSYIDML